MVKILGGVLAAIAIAVGGFFGMQFYMQHRVVSGIEGAFEQIRAAGGKASYGKVSFDLLSRTVTVADIATQSSAQPPANIKIARIVASNVSQQDATRFSADSIEAADVEVAATIGTQPGSSVTYKAPLITVKDYSGPAGLPPQPASSSAIDQYRAVIGQFAGINAASISIASIVGTMRFGTSPQDGTFSYAGLEAQGIKDGKISTTKVDGFSFAVTTLEKGRPQKVVGEMTNLAMLDFDAMAIAAAIDPQNANDDRYRRVYRQVATGPYTITAPQGVRTRIEGLTVDDVGLRPSRMKLETLLAMIPPAGTTPSPAQARQMMENVAGFYQGLRIGNMEARDISLEIPAGGSSKLSAMRLNLEDGKVREFAFEGFDTSTPKGPFKVGRFALKSLDLAGLMRFGALYATPAPPPSPDQALGLLPLLEGVELKTFAAPFKNTSKRITIDTINLDWGQFVGPIPSKLRLALKMAAPLDASNPAQKMLVAAGLDTAVLDLDLGAAWAEASRTFALEPASLELGGVLKASVRVSLANVPKGAFSPNLAQATAAAAQIEAGTLELVLRDTGGVDFTVAQQAREQNISREEARSAIAEGLRTAGKEAATTNPDAVAAAQALARFFETPGQTLNIKLTPLGKVPMLQLIQLLKTDPVVALAQFRIEASTGL
ncbi:hypothetical protein JQ628_13015 [Bradyrhizobium lablabi]|uniref:hypothetical protein n=1 Tax=Bradyrhizobium lablabi TaxID=722472 RepID=UPI001BAAEB22|nr:hypothetical protein [Bradyrhizobium lablabi]MBR1122440.1 hypothetical protein [Bradyrhizobium lablabi]